VQRANAVRVAVEYIKIGHGLLVLGLKN